MTPFGEIAITARGGAVSGLYFWGHSPSPRAAFGANDEDELLRASRIQVEEYLAGERRDFDVPVAPEGTEFQMTVWQELQSIPYGQAISYQELARRVGSPKGYRAVGSANGRNPISIIIPCHRVIQADRTLGGYGGGLPVKAALLRLEGTSFIDPRQGQLGL
jgi:methylated-DNA-[protein]-cysteine S-methyltransferase